MKKTISFLLPLLLGVSCTQEDLVPTPKGDKQTESNQITLQQAQTNAIDFVVEHARATRGSIQLPQVGECFTVTSGRDSRTQNSELVADDTLYHIINFADSAGFVIAGADKRAPEVYAYVPQGNYNPNSRVSRASASGSSMIGDEPPGFENFINNLGDYAKKLPIDVRLPIDNVQKERLEGDIAPPSFYHSVEPRLPHQWHQRGIFRRYCPDNCIAGCVMVASALACNYVAMPKSFNGIALDWAAIDQGKTEYQWRNIPEMDQLAQFIRYLGKKLDADYTPGDPNKNLLGASTGADSDDAIEYLQDIGVNATDLRDYKASDAVEQLLTKNCILYMRGNTDRASLLGLTLWYKNGHAWIADGAIHKRQGWSTDAFLHINWGWGTRIGYYHTDILDYNQEVSKPTRSDASHYKYNLEISVICKP